MIRFGPIKLNLRRYELSGAREALAEIGRDLAASMRARIESGLQADGRALPRPRDGGQPFVRTGRFVRSIRFRRTSRQGGGYVQPTGLRVRARSKAHARALLAGTSIGGGRARGRSRGRLANSNADLARLYLARRFWHPSGQSVVLMGATAKDRADAERTLAGRIKLRVRVQQD